MSYILDALKKLEHEKSRKSRSDGMINISGALFEDDRPKPARTAGWKIVLAVTVAVLVTFGATWQFLKPPKWRETSAPSLSAAPVSLIPPAPAETAPTQAVPPAVPVQQARPVAPSAPATVPPAKPTAHPPIPKKAVLPATSASEDAASLLTIQELRNRTKDRKGQVLSADKTIAAPADIKLSGIAWQEERRARRAVINGFLMQEGEVVSGARITDIFQDRVRLSLSGNIFEIPLISSTVSPAGK